MIKAPDQVTIASTAVVETRHVGPGTRIGEFAVVRASARLGENVTVHPHAVIGEGVRIGDGVEIFPGAFVGKEPKGAGATARTSEFERTVTIGACCSIGTNAVVYYDVRIGENTLVGDGASVREGCSVGDKCVVGAHVTVGYAVQIHRRVKVMDHTSVVGKSVIEDGAFVSLNVGMANDQSMGVNGYREEHIHGVTIRKGAMVGVGANLLPGVEIGEGAIVGAGALVTKPVEARTVVMGVPARFQRRVERLSVNDVKA